jgi:hypothetical protein
LTILPYIYNGQVSRHSPGEDVDGAD